MYRKWKAIWNFLIAINFFSQRFSKAKNEGYKRLRLLDYGSGFGHILDLSKTFGIDAYGVEIDKIRINHCIKKGLKVTRPESLEPNDFDIIISTSVIEHVIDLHEYLHFISSKLKTGGIFYFNGLTPKIIDIERKRGRYSVVHPIEHLSMFNRKSLIRLCEKYRLQIVPMSLIMKVIKRNGMKSFPLFPFLFFRSIVERKGGFTAIMMKK